MKNDNYRMSDSASLYALLIVGLIGAMLILAVAIIVRML